MNEQIERLPLKQRIALCSGLNEWDTKEGKDPAGEVYIPSVKVSDGPHGLRKTIGHGDNLGLAGSYPATCFPAESLLACSFDRELAKTMGSAIADEARAAGVSTILGPGANIKRNPLCGRNFEYLSEDPFLTGRMAAAYIEGVQSRGIGTSLKHFACNSQEYYRMTSDSRLDERTLRELYLSGFEHAIKTARPATVMCAYNKLNGISCSDNAFLLDRILRTEWGYQGLVVSDWGAVNDRIRAFEAGCDLIMPGGNAYGESDVYRAVVAGTLSEELVNRSASRVAAFATGQNALRLEAEGVYGTEYASQEALWQHGHGIARYIAEQSAVLLKNDEALLPLPTIEKDSVGIIGSMAKYFRFQGSGSSKINPTQKPDFLTALASLRGTVDLPDYAEGYSENEEESEPLLQAAVALASRVDTVVLFAGLPERYEAEGIDRRTMTLPPEQDRLIRAVAEVNRRVVVVLLSGCVVETPWEPEVKSILWMGLSGQGGAEALVRLLTGEVNPSGRLAESWPMGYEDCPSASCYLKEGKDAVYHEGIFVGYRHYDRAGITVRFPFGHGLSYSSFAYSDLLVQPVADHYRITVTVKNIGSRAGKEAVLLFVEAPQDGIARPTRELKGFEKVELAAGEEKQVCFETDERTFAVWNDGWITYAGVYQLCIGDCRLLLQLDGAHFTEVRQSAAFENAVVREEAPEGLLSVNSTISEAAEKVLLLRVLYRWFENRQARTFGRSSAEYLAAMTAADECPLRAVQNMLGIRHHFAQAIADFGNGYFIRGVKHLLR